MGKKPKAFICTSFERLKKLVETISGCDWDNLSPATQKMVTAGYIMHGNKTAVCVEGDKTISIFEVGALEGFDYSFFVPDEESED